MHQSEIIDLKPVAWELLEIRGGKPFYAAQTDSGEWLVCPESYPADRPAFFSYGSSADIGYAHTQADALALIEILLNGETNGDIASLLSDAGFLLHHQSDAGATQVTTYKKSIRTHSFRLFVSADQIGLTFEKKGWGRWERLARFHSRIMLPSGEFAPVAWPRRIIDNFQTLTVRACITMTERFIADGRNMLRHTRPISW